MNSQPAPFSQFTSFSASQSPQIPLFMPNMPSFFDPNQSSMSMSEADASQVAALQAKLNQKLGPEYVSQRPGPGGGPKLTYAEGWRIINLANEVFGFNGWSSSIINMVVDYCDYNEDTRRYNVGVSVLLRVTLKGGTYHEDVGYGLLDNSKSKGAALDKCKKEAVTDALKRALRNFGNILGNCLYDKAYTSEIVKIKVPPLKFDSSNLYRRPEFSQDVKPDTSNTTAPLPPAVTIIKKDVTSPVLPKRGSAPTPVGPPPPAQTSHRAPSAVPVNPQNNDRGRVTPVPTLATDRNIQRQNAATSSKAPPPQRQIPPKASSTAQNDQAPPPQQQRVLLEELQAEIPPEVTENIAREPDESFGFSDDDAFLANVDMGDGDLGRPIDYEGEEDESLLDDEPLQLHPAPQHQVAPRQGQQQQSSSGNSRQAQQPAQRQGPSSSNSVKQQPPQQQKTNIVQPVSTSTPFKRSSAAGGFNFPPGMNPENISKEEVPPRQTDNTRIIAGMKRASTDVPNTARSVHGMGLAQQQARAGVSIGGSNTDERDTKRFKR